MTGANRLRFAGLLLAAALSTGCAGLEIEERTRATRARIRDAREAGAYRCAPRQLALAEANVLFAENELHQGDYFRAKEHAALAEQNASDAIRRSPAATCKGGKPAPPPVVATARDSDGDGVLDPDDKCVVEPEDRDGFEDGDGCPEPDNDADGVPDGKDKCPVDAEDLDRFEDQDGCPDSDNDRDGVPDARDGCPLEAEDPDGFEDEDGCPERDNDRDTLDDVADRCPNEPGPPGNGGCPQTFKLIEVKKDKIELRQKIFFDTGNARIQPRSFALLDEIGEAIKSRPAMKVRIEGHTDSRGKRDFNVRLSQQRADSVRAHLMGLGIEPERLQAVGFGPDQPIETNKTAAGREMNRRVEFVITAQ